MDPLLKSRAAFSKASFESVVLYVRCFLPVGDLDGNLPLWFQVVRYGLYLMPLDAWGLENFNKGKKRCLAFIKAKL